MSSTGLYGKKLVISLLAGTSSQRAGHYEKMFKEQEAMACAAGGSNRGVPEGTWGWADRRFPSMGPLGKLAYGFNCKGTLNTLPPPLQFLPPIPWSREVSRRWWGRGGEGTSNSPHTSGPVDLIMVGWDQLEGWQGRDRGGDGNSFHAVCLKVTIREKAKPFHI